MNFYSFHIGDFAKRTKHLGPIEDIVYRRMLDLYYLTENPLPLDPSRIERLIGMKGFSENISEIVSEILSDFFLKSEDGWRNKRCDEEIEKYHGKVGRANKANQARWEKGEEQGEQQDSDNDLKLDLKLDAKSDLKSDLKSDAFQIPTNNQEPITNKKKEKICVLFEEFWRNYPDRNGKKLEKGAAFSLFEKLKPEDQEKAIQAATNFSRSFQVQSGIGIKDPKRFLRDGKGNEPWRDWIEPETPSIPQKPKETAGFCDKLHMKPGHRFKTICKQEAVGFSGTHPRCREHLHPVEPVKETINEEGKEKVQQLIGRLTGEF